MISLIIPAHNEAAFLGPTLASASAALASLGEPSELIVVNDASTDATADIARSHGARVLDVELRHIAAVRNAGAAAARGDRLVFLDADTLLPPATLLAAHRALSQGSIGGGCLVRFDQPLPLSARPMVQLWNSLSRACRWAAGSFVFVQRNVFESVGGFSEQYFAAEEIVLSIALKKLGPFTILPHHIVTSARKMHAHPLRAHLGIMLKTFATFGRAIQQRDGLHIWYGDQRNTTAEPDTTAQTPDPPSH